MGGIHLNYQGKTFIKVQFLNSDFGDFKLKEFKATGQVI